VLYGEVVNNNIPGTIPLLDTTVVRISDRKNFVARMSTKGSL